jgi:membrane-associated phospholipid phosphatase
MASRSIAQTVAVTAASLCLGGCATARKPAAIGHSEPVSPSASPATSRDIEPNLRILSEIPDQREPTPTIAIVPVTDSPPKGHAGQIAYVEPLFSKEYGKLVIQDVREVFTAPVRWRTKEWVALGILGGTVAGFTYLDEAIRDWDQAHRASPSDTFAKEIAPLGANYSLFALGAFYLAGTIWEKPKARAVAQDGLAASLITSVLILPALKFTFGRSRPHEEHGSKDFDIFDLDKTSFPSGHTAQAYTVAAVIAAHYDSWWIKGASYGAASVVGWARVHQDRHFTSDCVAGAIIGTFVGHTVARYNQRHRAKAGQRKTTLTPFYDGRATGLAINYNF